MGDLRIERMINTDPGFYQILGPFLSRRSIVRDLGDPVWDDDGKFWFVALDGNAVAGFAGLRSEETKHVFCSAYVLPVCRRQGVYTLLVDERIKILAQSPRPAVATARTVAVPALMKVGFTVVSQTERYARMRREP